MLFLHIWCHMLFLQGTWARLTTFVIQPGLMTIQTWTPVYLCAGSDVVMPGKQSQSLKAGGADFLLWSLVSPASRKGYAGYLPATSSFQRNGTLEDLKGAREIHAKAACVKALICLALKSWICLVGELSDWRALKTYLLLPKAEVWVFRLHRDNSSRYNLNR